MCRTGVSNHKTIFGRNPRITRKRRTNTLGTQIWQMTQSNATKTENLENDFMEPSTTTRDLGWSDEKDNPKVWIEKAQGSESHGDQFAWRKTRGQGNE